VTYQDSCNYIRNAGLSDMAREIMSYIAEDFREMRPNREHNFCCGGGGGLNGIGRYRQQRNKGLKVKRDQILATGCKLVIAPCHNCWDAIRDLDPLQCRTLSISCPRRSNAGVQPGGPGREDRRTGSAR
jgi:Fe-S oxidoreductase